MKGYVLLVYNPAAGSQVFPAKLDYVAEVFQEKGLEVRLYRTGREETYGGVFEGRDLGGCKAVLVAGGDGTVNAVVNRMQGLGEPYRDIPLGIIPAGTANDFAFHLGIPSNISEAVDRLGALQSKDIDLGHVNDRFFINVCSGGLLTTISQYVDPELKNTLGKLAYYLKGVQQLPRFKKLDFTITTEHWSREEELYLFLVLNGSSAGGFNAIGPDSSVEDGLLDFVGVRACPIQDIPLLFAKILMGDHLNDRNILHFRAERITIDCKTCLEGWVEEAEGTGQSDVDGEAGPDFPLEIRVLPGRLKILY
ncbi:YegS/Rv2252/BmrU family lipid kinase [Anaerotalea alkaliphila]|uniref:YegS/Rv2252/BmrU family lipid kinase n=1 Tax=Anaerotalea alkaliphila TaxID=2662126 RepID=A0A7X5HW42_9FIRM|nr:YegS/Rv2252/BmrU family lipid kinase [Anaerotalea alkaliphila]NDL67745.1 YegS/Rv2252/BmrU family lipid kinase [Anaerotalea alkaliphila]